MIIAVETNFVYEVVMQQEEATAGTSPKVHPRRRNDAFKGDRPQPYAAAFLIARPGVAFGARACGNDEAQRLVDFQTLTAKDLDAIPLTVEILEHATRYHAIGEIREWPDAVVFESVLAGLESRRTAGDHQPAIFVSRDRKAFRTGWALQQLRALDCRLIASFVDALGVIRKAAAQRL